MSGATGECNAVFKECRKLLLQCNRIQAKLESASLDLSHTRVRQEALMTPTNVGRLRAMHDVQPLMDEAKEVMLRAGDVERRFLAVAKEQASVKKTIFYRCKHVLSDVERSKLSLAFLLHHFVITLLRIVSCRNSVTSGITQESCYNCWLYRP